MCVLVIFSLALPATAMAGPAAPAPPGTSVTPAEAQSLLDLLNDPKKRAAFTATLETMVHAQKATAPPKPVALAPNSLGAQVIAEGSTWLSQLSGEVNALGGLLGNLPLAWRFTLHSFQNPEARARVLDAAWRVGLVLAAAIAADLGLFALLRRPVSALAARAPASVAPTPASLPEPDPSDAGPALDEPDPSPPNAPLPPARRSRALHTLRRLPFALFRLLLELAPVGAFLAIGYAGTLLNDDTAQNLLRFAIVAYLLWRLAAALTRVLVSPQYPSLRLVQLSDIGAAYALGWVRRLFAVAAIGYALVAIGLEFRLPMAAARAFFKAVALIDVIFLVVIVLQCRRNVALWIRGRRRRSGLTHRLRDRLAANWHLLTIFVLLGGWLVWAGQVHHGYTRLLRLTLFTGGALVAGRLAAIVLLGGLDRLFRISPQIARRYPGLEARANRYYPLLRYTLGTIVTLATGLGVLEIWGVQTMRWFRGAALGGRLASALITILIAGLVALAVWEIANSAMDRQLVRMTREAQLVRAARLRTLLPILRTLLLATLVGIFGLTMLSEIGVNIAPLLAGAGILGVAIGFGSQKLVQDFITGIFLLLENAMQVGDWVTVAGLSGSVENLSIRTMRLRAGDGSVHIIPFSSVSTVTNVNRGIGNAAVSVNVPIEEDPDHVSDVLANIAKEMRGERRFAEMMRSDFQLWGVDRVDAGVMTIVGQIVCTDSGRWAVQREFNRRMTLRFKEAGIQIATPTQTILTRRAPAAEPQIADAAAPPPPHQLRESPPPAALGNTG